MTHESRFWSRVNQLGLDECWEWTHKRNPAGYGLFTMNRKHYLSHRLAWRFLIGPIPNGMCVCHRCDNRSCCNPAHLFLGTQADNNKDCIANGRADNFLKRDKRGEKNGRSKLTKELVKDIRSMLDSGATYESISNLFGICKSSVYNIKSGRTWST